MKTITFLIAILLSSSAFAESLLDARTISCSPTYIEHGGIRSKYTSDQIFLLTDINFTNNTYNYHDILYPLLKHGKKVAFAIGDNGMLDISIDHNEDEIYTYSMDYGLNSHGKNLVMGGECMVLK